MKEFDAQQTQTGCERCREDFIVKKKHLVVSKDSHTEECEA